MGLNDFAQSIEKSFVNDEYGFGEVISYLPVDATVPFQTRAFVSSGDFRVSKSANSVETVENTMSFLSVDTNGINPKKGDKITYGGNIWYVHAFKGSVLYDFVCSNSKRHTNARSSRRTS